MPAYKVWSATGFTPASGDALEISELQLFAGAARVDAPAVLTYASAAAPSGAIGNLKDGVSTTGCYWASSAASVVLTWTFATPQEVTGIKLGSRTTAARHPVALVLVGYAELSGGVLRADTVLGFGGLPFEANTLTGVLTPAPDVCRVELPVVTLCDYNTHAAFGGRVRYKVERQVTPGVAASRVPQWAKVRLERDIDGAVVAEQWSHPVTGEGVFEHIDPDHRYTVTAIYPGGGMRAVIADGLTPEPMP